MRITKGTIILTVIVLFILQACDKRKVFDKNKEVALDGWAVNDIVRFEVPISNSKLRYNFYINVRNNTNYSFSNLFLFINTIYPDRKISKDTVECWLADQNGKWLGDGLGQIKNNRILFKRGFRFDQVGTYVFEFQQGMRVEKLKGINSIGLRIETLK